MKVLHLPGSYPPWVAAGKEIYTHTLALALRDLGVESEVAVTAAGVPGADIGDYEHEGVPVHVLPAAPGRGTRRAFFAREFPDLPGFDGLLDRVRPDVVHFHDQNDGASLTHLRAVKDRGLPAVLTHHSPGQTCPHHDLLRWGTTPCDGELLLNRCTACRLSASGVPRPVGRLAGLAEWPGADPESPGAAAKLLNARRMTRWFRDSVTEFGRRADAVVVLAEWCGEVWLRNGLDPAKLHLVRSGGRAERPRDPGPKFPDRPTLVVGYAGRCEPIKGVHVLVEAVRSLPADFPVEARLFGGGWDGAYGRHLLGKIGGDRRFVPPRVVPNAEMGREFARLDAAVIPSTCPETGPLTLFDAFAAGTPVIGSRLGGIAERVADGADGLLFPPGDAAALAACLRRCVGEPALLPRLRAGVRPPRTVHDTAAEMVDIYSAVVSGADRRAEGGSAGRSGTPRLVEAAR